MRLILQHQGKGDLTSMHRHASTTSGSGLALIEWIVLIVLVAVLAFILIPRISQTRGTPSLRRTSVEAQLESDLTRLRTALNAFHKDCGLYPLSLFDLAAQSPPRKGWDTATRPPTMRDLEPAKWKGPYLQAVPKDPVTGKDFVYGWRAGGYDVWSESEERSSRGTPYSKW
jgi:type II secretory pathway pseudopilin PulG